MNMTSIALLSASFMEKKVLLVFFLNLEMNLQVQVMTVFWKISQ